MLSKALSFDRFPMIYYSARDTPSLEAPRVKQTLLETKCLLNYYDYYDDDDDDGDGDGDGDGDDDDDDDGDE